MPGSTEFETLSFRVAGNGVAFIAIDVKDRPVNVLTPELHQDIGKAAEQLAGDDKAVGAVIHSGKPSFMAGGDLKRIVRYYDMGRTPEQAYTQSRTYTESLRKLETCGKPVAVAVNGTALGGGLELALACHYRVLTDDPKALLGFPEVTLGLLPGGGGTQRLPRLIGLKEAASLILSGRRISPSEALELGVVDKLAATDDLVTEAEKWVLENGAAEQPWDQKGFRVPGGAGLNDVHTARLFQQLTARVSAEYRHNYPAPIAILRCLFNGTTVSSMDTALKIETGEFSALTRDPVARNIIRTLFLNKKKAGPSANGEDGPFSQRCKVAYIREGLRLVGEGVKPALIENAGFAAGLPLGPLALADEMSLSGVRAALAGDEACLKVLDFLVETSGRAGKSGGKGFYDYGADGAKALWDGIGQNFNAAGPSADVEVVKQRLLCAQALAAAECWEESMVEPVDADLASIADWGFPTYTGGVMSYIDTLGISAFVELCDRLAEQEGAPGRPSDWLRKRAREDDRIYPSMA